MLVGWTLLGWWVVVFAGSPAIAQTMTEVTVTWDTVTERENGELLKPEELVGYELEHRDQSSENLIATHESDAQAVSQKLLVDMAECHTFRIRAMATGVKSCTTNDAEPELVTLYSEYSETVGICPTSGKPEMKPQPPRSFKHSVAHIMEHDYAKPTTRQVE